MSSTETKQPASDASCDDDNTSDPGLTINAAVATHDAGATADANVSGLQDVSVVGNADLGTAELGVGAQLSSFSPGDTDSGQAELGASARFASFSLGDVLGGDDCGGDSSSIAAPDTEVQLALSAEAPTDLGVLDQGIGSAGDLGLLGGEPVSLSALDVPSVDLCSLGDHI